MGVILQISKTQAVDYLDQMLTNQLELVYLVPIPIQTLVVACLEVTITIRILEARSLVLIQIQIQVEVYLVRTLIIKTSRTQAVDCSDQMLTNQLVAGYLVQIPTQTLQMVVACLATTTPVVVFLETITKTILQVLEPTIT